MVQNVALLPKISKALRQKTKHSNCLQTVHYKCGVMVIMNLQIALIESFPRWDLSKPKKFSTFFLDIA